ncbi:hypothetical protein COU78_05275 [Candidatus Peregrinibacteria bacterium CG10_big_fil_rev_8_21_14_0_10_49_24]|nr:MAG: hypothetical protein COV83_01645 [Candidatus Peregrinibacteria bacterium CG11_big_fil_rev_8_21_14_0_20_49_14]PIR50757.1 MAG: hypothetical protein COU78_05275 [Candidatus Peregrinibacteria bacterium CG10_big_fil_rev_8_21_14_0_10_49_24]PJA68198.1 MAG: hypothetical protein CO157_00535 [Candidatus Peregrinibacteria bacterium CG_4_9_14_3_um_filter_49_12]
MTDSEAQRIRRLSIRKLREYISEQGTNQPERKDGEHVLKDRIERRNTMLKVAGIIATLAGIIVASVIKIFPSEIREFFLKVLVN